MKIGNWLTEVRRQRPLVHNMTNLVVTNAVANALLAIGASPVMAYAHEEVADMAKIARSLALNMGTLTPDLINGMLLAGGSAKDSGVPIVFDPVGVGATPYRTSSAEAVLQELPLAVLRGNAAEIGLLVGAGGRVSGVDASGAGENLPSAMAEFARAHGTVVVATGETDWVTDGNYTWTLHNGHGLLSRITGSGCMLTGLIGAFIGVVDRGSSPDKYAAASAAAVTCLNVAAEQAALRSQGPGTFQAQLFDALYNVSETDVDQAARIELAACGA